MASTIQRYTASHTGNVLGEEYVDTMQNQTEPQRESAILAFEGPKKFESLEYVGNRDSTRFIPRSVETDTYTDDDASGALEAGERTTALAANLQPVAGEKELGEQDYPAVVAANVTQGVQINASDLTLDYAADEVTVAESAVADGDDVKFWPIINEGTVQYRALNQFDQVEGTVYPWPTPVYRWHDFEQLKRGTEVNLQGRVSWGRYETVEVLLDSPRQIVWKDADFPEGEFVSTFEQDLSIHL